METSFFSSQINIESSDHPTTYTIFIVAFELL